MAQQYHFLATAAGFAMGAWNMQTRKRSFGRCLMVLCLAFTGACSAESEAPQKVAGTNEGAELIPAGDLMRERIAFQLAIFYLPKPTTDPLAALDILLKEQFAEFKRVDQFEDPGNSLVVMARLETDPRNSYTPPTLDALRYCGRGLSSGQAEALQKTEQALVLVFAYSRDHVWDGMRSAVRLVDALARQTGGIPWDEATREVFSLEEWQRRRIEDWTETIPDISRHTVIHAYRKDDYLRAITLGMEKFGLPDLVIEDFSSSLGRNMGHILNLFAQTISEGATVQRPGQFDLEIKAIKNAKVREAQIAAFKQRATGVALLSLKQGTSEDGDPDNRLIEIGFERGAGPDIHAKQEQIVSTTFGSEDSVTAVEHDAKLLAASDRARRKLPALRTDFNKGLAPGEHILVKAPFETADGGHEWMWVEVTTWNGDRIKGTLQNDPRDIPTLHSGQVVEVSEAELFDFLRRRPDGTMEGNETGKLIEEGSK